MFETFRLILVINSHISYYGEKVHILGARAKVQGLRLYIACG